MEEANDVGLQLVAILWHAAWTPLADDALQAVQALAERHQHVMFLCLDVEGSEDNRKFGFEKVRCFRLRTGVPGYSLRRDCGCDFIAVMQILPASLHPLQSIFYHTEGSQGQMR